MKHLSRDASLFVLLLIVFFLGRLALLFIFGADKISQITSNWTLLAFRFDLMTAAYLVLPMFCISIISMFFKEYRFLEFIKKHYAIFVFGCSVFFAALNVLFFYEYKSQFNQWILGIFYDDFVAIMGTIVREYPVFWIFLGILLLWVLCQALMNFIFRKTENIDAPKHLIAKIVLLLFAIPVFTFCLRGASFSYNPLKSSDAVISDSAFLNNLIPNSAYCIQHELKTHFEFLSFDDSLKFFDTSFAEIPQIAENYLGKDIKNIDEGFLRTAQGSPLKEAPKHVFLIIAESHSAWPMFEKYQERNLMQETLKLVQKSLASRHALSAGICTVDTVTSILGGIPFAMLSASCIKDYPKDYSIAKPFNDLGYKTRFFTASSAAWCNIGTFTRHIGFTESFGGDIVGEEFNLHAWGVPDRQFFQYLLNFDFSESSFNVFLTVSNHPPYEVDLKREGCPNKIDTPLENKVQHIWYADMCIGEFVKQMRKKYPDSLFIITGDHPARLNPPYLDDDFENRMCVPLIFTGKAIEDENLQKELATASHMDIGATLAELILPKGHQYLAWGENLLDQKRKHPPVNPYAIYYEGALRNPKTSSFPEGAKEAMQAYLSLAYWRAVKGSEFPKEGEDSLQNSISLFFKKYTSSESSEGKNGK